LKHQLHLNLCIVAKGVRKGYLPAAKLTIAKKGLQRYYKTFKEEWSNEFTWHGKYWDLVVPLL
jgi:hypothetical protein